MLEPIGPLRPEDFDAVALVVDPWIESHGTLRGLVVYVKRFPGWESVGALVQQLQFMREHHRWVHRVAVVADNRIAELAPTLTKYFFQPELKHFDRDRLDTAIAWASA